MFHKDVVSSFGRRLHCKNGFAQLCVAVCYYNDIFISQCVFEKGPNMSMVTKSRWPAEENRRSSFAPYTLGDSVCTTSTRLV